MMGNSQAATETTASRRPGGLIIGNDAGRSFQELVASAKGGDVEAQSLLALRYMFGEGDLEEDLREAGMFNFTDGMRHLDTMPPDVRLAIFKHLDAADLCRLGCTSWSVESWLRIQPAVWAQCLITSSESASHDDPPVPNRLWRGHSLPRTKQVAYCFSLNRLELMGVAAAPYAEAIAAHVDAPKYGGQVAQAAVRTLGKLGAAALPHVHRILTCATDKMHHKTCNRNIYHHSWSGNLRPYAEALIRLLPHLKSTQQLQDVVTHLEKSGYYRPDLFFRMFSSPLNCTDGVMADMLLSSYVGSGNKYDYGSSTSRPADRPVFSDIYHISRKSIKKMLASLQVIHSKEDHVVMQRSLEVKMESMKAKLEARMKGLKSELEVRVTDTIKAYRRVDMMAERLKAELECRMERRRAELEDKVARMKAELNVDKMERTRATKLMEDSVERMKAELEGTVMEGMETELGAWMDGVSAALLEASYGQHELQIGMERMKAELDDRKRERINESTELMEDKMERMKATELEGRMESMKAELEARMEEMSAALLEASTSAAAARPSPSWQSPVNPASVLLTVLYKHRRKTHWPLPGLMLAALGCGIVVMLCLC